jgi:hypothetical protein
MQVEGMTHSPPDTSKRFLTILLACMLALGGLPAMATAADIYANIGDTIPLNGTALLVDTVYMYMTGPGVPSNGARMDNSNAAVVTGDPSTFTPVPVHDDTWIYTWNTGRVTGGLAAGLYRVYIATQPAAADNLAGVQYSDIQIQLSTAVTTGSLFVSSSPMNAQVSLNGKYMGNTPLTLTDLAPDDYTILLELQGYESNEGRVSVVAGKMATYSATLEPIGTTVTSIPITIPSTTAQVTTPLPSSPTPTPAPLPWIVIVLSIGLVFLARVSRR